MSPIGSRHLGEMETSTIKAPFNFSEIIFSRVCSFFYPERIKFKYSLYIHMLSLILLFNETTFNTFLCVGHNINLYRQSSPRGT